MKKQKQNKKQATTPNGGIIYTVQGEYFPDIYPAIRSPEWHRGDEDSLATEMRLFCACIRWAFNGLLEGRTREELKREGQDLFGLNSRYSDDAILKAKEVVVSQGETKDPNCKRKARPEGKFLTWGRKRDDPKGKATL